jgi:hypothetical protein
VAYVSGRATGLAVALTIAALLMHERSVEGRKHAKRWAMLLFVCACASKEIALVFPALILLWERTRLVPIDWSTALRRTTPYAIASIVAAVFMLTMSSRYRELLAYSLALHAPPDALLRNLIALPMSVSLWFRPLSLSVEHEVPYSAPALLLSLALIAALLTVAIRERDRRPYITLALLWPPLSMLLSHSFIAKADAITEGPLYFAWVGPSVALGEWLACRARVGVALHLKAVGVAIGVLAIALCQWRGSVWRNPIALWEEATERAPHSARAWANLGVARLARGDEDTARAALHTALQLDPNNMQARFNLDIVAALAASTRSTQKP